MNLEHPILQKADLDLCFQRMAAELLETIDPKKPILLLGIQNNGFPLAQALLPFLNKNLNHNIPLLAIQPDKAAPWNQTGLQQVPNSLQNTQAVLIDDVLNTGQTVAYVLADLLKRRPLCLKLLVLVDRAHKTFPIAADVAGFRLSTLPGQFVRVDMQTPKPEIWLAENHQSKA